MSDKNLHWAVAAGMIRRGGHAKRGTRIVPENIDGTVYQQRESNKRAWGTSYTAIEIAAAKNFGGL